MNELEPVKNMWVCASSNGNTQPHTISYTKTECIRKMIEGSSMLWIECEKYGWRCVKVNVVYETIKPKIS